MSGPASAALGPSRPRPLSASTPAINPTHDLALRRRLRKELDAIQVDLDKTRMSDPKTVQIQQWLNNFKQATNNAIDFATMLNIHINQMQQILRDALGIPLSFESFLYSDNRVYDAKTIAIHNRHDNPEVRARSPLDPNNAALFAQIGPHYNARRLLVWLGAHNALPHIEGMEKEFKELMEARKTEPILPPAKRPVMPAPKMVPFSGSNIRTLANYEERKGPSVQGSTPPPWGPRRMGMADLPRDALPLPPQAPYSLMRPLPVVVLVPAPAPVGPPMSLPLPATAAPDLAAQAAIIARMRADVARMTALQAEEEGEDNEEHENFRVRTVRVLGEIREDVEGQFAEIRQEADDFLDEQLQAIADLGIIDDGLFNELQAIVDNHHQGVVDLERRVRALENEVTYLDAAIDEVRIRNAQVEEQVNDLERSLKKSRASVFSEIFAVVAVLGVCITAAWALQGILAAAGSSAQVVGAGTVAAGSGAKAAGAGTLTLATAGSGTTIVGFPMNNGLGLGLKFALGSI